MVQNYILLLLGLQLSFADAVANPSLAGINLSGGKSDVSRAQHEERTAFIWGERVVCEARRASWLRVEKRVRNEEGRWGMKLGSFCALTRLPGEVPDNRYVELIKNL